MKLLILIIFLFNCLNIKNFKNESLQENLLASLLGERNFFQIDTLATRRVTGQLVDNNYQPISNARMNVTRTNKRDLIDKMTSTADQGYFSINMKIGIFNIDIIKDNIKIGEIILNIKENNATYTSDNFRINELLSVYIYPSGYEKPIAFVNYSLSKLYYGSYYLNVEFANVSEKEMTFVSSSVTSKTEGVVINYPYFDNDPKKNSVSKNFLGVRMIKNEHRSIYTYMQNFWKYEDKYYDSEKYVRFYSPTDLTVDLVYDKVKNQYFQIIVDDTIFKGSTVELKISFTENNGTIYTIPFLVTF